VNTTNAADGRKGPNARRDALLAELVAARTAFRAAFADVDRDLLTAPGLLGDWSARDLVAHVAFWADHGADALALAAAGRAGEYVDDGTQTDDVNAARFAVSQGMSPDEAADDEARAFTRFRDALAGIDGELLDVKLGSGDTVEEMIRYDGPEHYAGHTAHVRAWFTGEPDPPDEDESAELTALDAAAELDGGGDEEPRGGLREAIGEFTVTGGREETYVERSPGKLTRAGGTQAFTGAIVGSGTVEWLMSYPGDGTARYVGLQLIEGTLDGRRGSFVLTASGAFGGTTSEATWTVVPGSGRGELAGISGSGGFSAGPGPQGRYRLSYRLG
jgi:hypothetical protein